MLIVFSNALVLGFVPTFPNRSRIFAMSAAVYPCALAAVSICASVIPLDWAF